MAIIGLSMQLLIIIAVVVVVLIGVGIGGCVWWCRRRHAASLKKAFEEMHREKEQSKKEGAPELALIGPGSVESPNSRTNDGTSQPADFQNRGLLAVNKAQTVQVYTPPPAVNNEKNEAPSNEGEGAKEEIINITPGNITPGNISNNNNNNNKNLEITVQPPRSQTERKDDSDKKKRKKRKKKPKMMARAVEVKVIAKVEMEMIMKMKMTLRLKLKLIMIMKVS